MKTLNESNHPTDKSKQIVGENTSIVIVDNRKYDYLPPNYRPSAPYYTPPMHKGKGV